MKKELELQQDETITLAVPIYENHLSIRVNRYSWVEAGLGWRSSCALLTGRGGAQQPHETFLREREIELLMEALSRALAQMNEWRKDPTP